MDIEDTSQNTSESNKWRCCCLPYTSHPKCVRISIIASLSFFILIFSSCMLAFKDLDCNEQHTYIGLITLISGFWMRSPLD